MAYAKINSVTNANMAKVSSAAKAAIGKIANIDAPSSDDAFTFTVNTALAGSASDVFDLPLVSDGTINFTVDWGDSTTDTITSYNQAEATHTYAAGAGIYTVKLEGTIRGFKFDNAGDDDKILDISNWGDLNITTPRAFRGCSNLTCSATDAPTVSSTDMTYAFRNCVNFNGAVGNWDVSAVQIFKQFFYNCEAFDQDLNDWDMSSATSLQEMFIYCDIFNGNISSWDTSSVTTLQNMFYGVSTGVLFNSDIGSWNTSEVTNMNRTFYRSNSFDQSLADWNIEKVTDFSSFMDGSPAVVLSTANYDATLIGWAAQDAVDSLSVHFGSSKYTAAPAAGGVARQSLIDNDSWTITDGGAA